MALRKGAKLSQLGANIPAAKKEQGVCWDADGMFDAPAGTVPAARLDAWVQQGKLVPLDAAQLGAPYDLWFRVV